jgi:hypothetical protein
MKFGIFMAPFHKVGENPALAFERDLQLIELLDELGYDEALSVSITRQAGRLFHRLRFLLRWPPPVPSESC